MKPNVGSKEVNIMVKNEGYLATLSPRQLDAIATDLLRDADLPEGDTLEPIRRGSMDMTRADLYAGQDAARSPEEIILDLERRREQITAQLVQIDDAIAQAESLSDRHGVGGIVRQRRVYQAGDDD